MITVIRISLSDLERGHLATALDDKATSRLVSRNEVEDIYFQAVFTEVQRGQASFRFAVEEQDDGNTDEVHDSDRGRVGQDGESNQPVAASETDGGDCGQERREYEDYLTVPTATGLANACRRVLEHIKEEATTDTLNLGWCASILLATGIK